MENKPLLKLVLKISYKIILFYIFVGLMFVCYFSSVYILGIVMKESATVVYSNAELAPVALGNPFLPYRDITPRVTSPNLHGYTAWSGQLSGTWEGIDYATPEGTPLYAPTVCPCVVKANGFDGWSGPYGSDTSYILLVSEDRQYEVMYQHGIYTAKPGTIVAPGVQIGTEASIGNSTGPHTHVAVRHNGKIIAANEHDNTAFITKAENEIREGVVTGSYADIITKYADMYNLDPLVVRGIIMQESNFNKDAVSPAGAMGLMQIMPITQGDQCPLANLFDPEQNIACGTKHLRWTIDQMGGDLEKGIMAYHSGVGNQRKRGATSLDRYYYEQVINYSKG